MSEVTNYLKGNYHLVILIAIFIFSFILDMYVLTRYSLSYGLDGAFYDIQVRNILQYGYPMSNDPPLAYYLLTPFVALTGNSFLGVKIGMAFIGSLMAFPAFFITECYVKKKDGMQIGSRIPALLSAFMVTVNVNYFSMLGNFMQNLVGVLFLLLFLYFTIRWFEDLKQWKKYGILTVLLLCVNLLTHIYTGALAVCLFFSLLVFSILVKSFKMHKLPIFDLKILGLLSFMVLIFLAVLFMVYPVMYTKYGTVLSFFNSSSTTTEGGSVSSPVSGIIFLSIPYLLGVASSIIILWRGLKEEVINADLSIISKNTLLSWVYISLTIILAVLVVIPSSQYQSRFLLMAFLPIGLLVPLGLKFIETELLVRYPTKKQITTLMVVLIAAIFAFSCYYTASESFNNLGPTITTDEYNELVAMKAIFANQTNQNIVILASDLQTKYWVEYVLGDVGNGNNITVIENIQGIQDKYQNTTIYSVSTQDSQSSLSDAGNSSKTSGTGTPGAGASGTNQGNMMGGNGMINGADQSNNYSLSFLLPYGPSILPNSLDTIRTGNDGSATVQGQMDRGNQHPGNMTNSTGMPSGNRNSTNGGPPGNMTDNAGNMTDDNIRLFGNMNNNTNVLQGGPGNNMGSSLDGQSQKIVESLTSSGTTIYNGKYFKLIRITV
ncbi:hypothetical protein GCM10025861_24000 [Methanobacterium petrolearium]|nr:hypothetical protein GCM10025861_24000 [Methanobacterium petrolearium]